MALPVAMSAQLMCSFGAAPSVLMVTPEKMVMMENKPAATIMDFVPLKNIMPFGTCSAPTNPAVIAALGSPVPCVPVVPAPWTPGAPTVLIANFPALNNSSKCFCTWAGVISVTNPGTTTEQVP